jgi:hypothetical protein
MKTLVTVWYLIMSFDGKEPIEGPTPELIEINHHLCTQPWTIKNMAAIVFEREFDNAVIHDIEIGDTAGLLEMGEPCRPTE